MIHIFLARKKEREKHLTFSIHLHPAEEEEDYIGERRRELHIWTSGHICVYGSGCVRVSVRGYVLLCVPFVSLFASLFETYVFLCARAALLYIIIPIFIHAPSLLCHARGQAKKGC